MRSAIYWTACCRRLYLSLVCHPLRNALPAGPLCKKRKRPTSQQGESHGVQKLRFIRHHGRTHAAALSVRLLRQSLSAKDWLPVSVRESLTVFGWVATLARTTARSPATVGRKVAKTPRPSKRRPRRLRHRKIQPLHSNNPLRKRRRRRLPGIRK